MAAIIHPLFGSGTNRAQFLMHAIQTDLPLPQRLYFP